MKASANSSSKVRSSGRFPTEEEIRDYAWHLYEHGGHRHGPDVDYWREAEACLRAHLQYDQQQAMSAKSAQASSTADE